ncbi:LacI family DNA-binding transcriptional regulator [Planctomycetota bacterium]|nr:LacI family DNA-binding transcriptional regulator [Planctomycetota bacterium]
MATKKSQECGSIYDLAKQTGLSTSTISRVLNQRGRISTETRQRVLAAARAAGFRPRAAVRQQTVALVIDRMRYASFGGFVTSIVTHLICELAAYDMSVEVYTEDNLDQLGTRFIDGVIALTWDPTSISKLQSLKNVPIILINRPNFPGLSTVATDHKQGGEMVAEYLIKHGHENIAFLGEEQDWGAKQRIAGFENILAKNKIKSSNLHIGFTEHQPVYGALKRLLTQKPTAIFLAGEDLTIEAIYVLNSVLNTKIPQNISVVGLESPKVSQFVQPPMTSLAQPLNNLASETLNLLREQIDKNSSKPQHIMIDNQLVERESVTHI